jgi:hypothetical protein
MTTYSLTSRSAHKYRLNTPLLFLLVLLVGFSASLAIPLQAQAKSKAKAQPVAGDPAACAAAAQQGVALPAGCAANASQQCAHNGCDLVAKYVSPTAEVLSASFGLVASISIIIAAIQYSASGGDPQKVSAAKKRLYSTVVAIVAYIFLFALLQFLIPGGVFQS